MNLIRRMTRPPDRDTCDETCGPVVYRGLISKSTVARKTRGENARLREVREHDHRWVAHRGILASERDRARVVIDAEDSDRIRALIAALQEPAARVEGETPGIVPARPFLTDERETAIGTH